MKQQRELEVRGGEGKWKEERKGGGQSFCYSLIWTAEALGPKDSASSYLFHPSGTILHFSCLLHFLPHSQNSTQ